MNEIIDALSEKMTANIEAFKRDLTKIRTGRATTSLLDGVKVMAYGSPMPMNQVGTVTIPESRMLVIQPWDTQLLPAIEKAIFSSDLGLNPSSDGKMIRINIPQLTEERRKELVKTVKKISEEHRVSMRNLRREAIDVLKKQKTNKEISEDDFFRMQDEAQHATDKFIKQIDEIMAEKEKEVMAV
ncbi:ribosome recycling factor [Thiovibrio frasassiensis]|uniref:Ribosome-recycling factor n=1 Tax=Thiovibrio frasassiensis TaxID=2984131 RepID=A0A9X4MJ34_9BACT|nr:ribosome recycling factor [Thiovibrio frasassiensis]MDG4476875.1 ribosome recycling factor [Thiovibrio frasassiensis]